MGDRFPGGVISKTPPTVVAPVDGEGGSASGVWSLDEVLGYEKAGAWPKGVLPRELYAWGRNISGQLGDDTTVARSSPVQIGALTNWAQVAVGTQHSISVKTDKTLWAWGINSSGQVGDNTIANKSSPIQVGALTNWEQVSAGSLHTAAVKVDGTLWTWGRNNVGQLGDNSVLNRSSPVQIGVLTDWSQVAGGGNHTAAVKSNGTIWAWGENGDGQVGDNTGGFGIRRSSPVQIGALTNWAQVAGGDDHTAAVKTDGTMWTWGGNSDGQLGQNISTSVFRSSPVQVGALTNWAAVSTGNSHTVSVKTDGTLWTWGRNNFGQIGDSSIIYRSSPVQVGALTNWSQVGGGHSDVVAAVKTDGTLWTWGQNIYGQLGQSDTISRSSPVQVGALTNWFQVSCSFHTLAITKG
jgi:alpha-tubulin suppressor-like RCC1 family protein